MKRFIFVTLAFVLSVLAGVLITSPASLGAATNVIAQREVRPLPTGMYLNVDAGYGSAELSFVDNGRYTYGDDGSVSAEGKYAIVGNQVTLIEYGPADAPCLHVIGTYTWAIRGNTLTLTEVDDPCATRQYDWKTGDWIKTRQ